MFRAKCRKINKKENSTTSSRNVLNIIKCNVFLCINYSLRYLLHGTDYFTTIKTLNYKIQWPLIVLSFKYVLI